MSNLLLTRIIKDFPNFSESELYSKVETSLLAIFHSLEDGYVQKKVELNIIKSNLESKILDLKNSNTKVRFEDIVFHKHAIKGYEKTDGVLIITVATSLEYYYSREKDGKLVDEYRDYKKQTSYTTRFIYVYDPEKYEKPFADLCAQANISSVKGHRSVGGYRASIYNAMTKEKIQVLIDTMQKLETL